MIQRELVDEAADSAAEQQALREQRDDPIGCLGLAVFLGIALGLVIYFALFPLLAHLL